MGKKNIQKLNKSDNNNVMNVKNIVNNAGRSYNLCNFNKKTSIKNYITVINTARSFMENNVGPGKLYDRYILMSIFVQNDSYLKNLKGYIKHIAYNKFRDDSSVIYVGNVFKDDLYISNHLVLKVPNNVIRDNNIETGMYIDFNGTIVKYPANSRDLTEGYKFGINRFEFNNVISFEYKANVMLINNIEKCDMEYNYYTSQLKDNYSKFSFMKFIMSKIHIITTKLYEKYAEDYYINMLLSLHFGDEIEKYMLTNQSDYNYLIKNAPLLIYPLTIILYILQELKMYDPYTIAGILVKYYATSMHGFSRTICNVNDLSYRDYLETMRRNCQLMDIGIDDYKYFNLDDNIKNFYYELIDDFNE